MKDMGHDKFDAVVIGAGIAGLSCALRLTELGQNVMLLEKGPDERYRCNTRISGGVFHVAHRDVAEDADTIHSAIRARTGDNVDDALLRGLAEGVGEAVAWLKANGVKYIKVGQEIYRRHTLAPPIKLGGKDYWLGRGGDAMLRALEQSLEKKGGKITRGAQAKSLILEEGQCRGVLVLIGGVEREIRGAAVVICDGGFQGNKELVERYITSAPDQLMQRNSGSGTGDGLQMALAAGAGIVAPSHFYGHVLSTDAFKNSDFWPFPIMDYICGAGIVVGRDGKRVIDEGLGGVRISNQLAQLDDPASTFVIYDQTIWEGPGKEYLPPTNPTLKNMGGTIHEANSIEALAQKIGLPAAALAASVSSYNQAVAMGTTPALSPTRSASAAKPHQIVNSPFYAVPICAGLTYTMGGILIDAKCRVLTEEGVEIPGLYAAGAAVGGMDGGDNTAYIGGLARSAWLAHRCAQTITERAKAIA